MNHFRFRQLVAIATIAILPSLFACANSAVGDELEFESAGPIAFGPGALLLVSDPMAAMIYAIETEDTEGTAENTTVNVKRIRAKVASLMGTEAVGVRINDMAINPINGGVYLSVTRGTGKDEVSSIVRVDGKTGTVTDFDFSGKKFTKTSIPNPAASRSTRRGNQRLQAITDMAFIDGQVYVAGLSNEEFASNLRAIAFPFAESNNGVSIEIYHGAHGQFETRSPIRTFAAVTIDDQVNLLAAYTCTPLVRIPLDDLKPESKVKGVTIAELGNRNRPLDMVVYEKNGKSFALMANSSRGVMKIDLSTAGSQVAIEERIRDTAGVPYETLKGLTGVMQLDRLNDTHAVVLVRARDGSESLTTIDLP